MHFLHKPFCGVVMYPVRYLRGKTIATFLFLSIKLGQVEFAETLPSRIHLHVNEFTTVHHYTNVKSHLKRGVPVDTMQGRAGAAVPCSLMTTQIKRVNLNVSACVPLLPILPRSHNAFCRTQQRLPRGSYRQRGVIHKRNGHSNREIMLANRKTLRGIVKISLTESKGGVDVQMHRYGMGVGVSRGPLHAEDGIANMNAVNNVVVCVYKIVCAAVTASVGKTRRGTAAMACGNAREKMVATLYDTIAT